MNSAEGYKKSAEDLRKVGLDDSFMLGAAQAIEDFEKIHKRPNSYDTVRIINAMIAKIFRTKSKEFYDGYKGGMREVMFSRGLR